MAKFGTFLSVKNGFKDIVFTDISDKTDSYYIYVDGEYRNTIKKLPRGFLKNTISKVVTKTKVDGGYRVDVKWKASKNPVEHWIIDNDTNATYLTLKTADRSKAEKIASDLNKKAGREKYIVRGFGVENPIESDKDRASGLYKFRVFYHGNNKKVLESDVWAASESDAKKIIKAQYAGMKIVIDKVRSYYGGVLQV